MSNGSPSGGGRVSPVLLALRRIGPFRGFLLALALVLVGLFAPGWLGALILLVLVVALAALASRTWPVTPPAHRAVRLVILALLLVVIIAKVD
ncbi:hypothetical protein GCM10009681_49820 [Luedemannella helvata]|uniref:Uncharacterized protein n=1 Tax=Luedemannella helvata TaxID=349315 RepID=A0ABN2L236_9ACTN